MILRAVTLSYKLDIILWGLQSLHTLYRQGREAAETAEHVLSLFNRERLLISTDVCSQSC